MSPLLDIYRPEFLEKMAEIQRLHDEAFEHYRNEGHAHKSSEGWIRLDIPGFIAREDGETRVGVSVYSYALGPSRMHDFDNIDDALAEVRRWHQREMAREPVEMVDWEDDEVVKWR